MRAAMGSNCPGDARLGAAKKILEIAENKSSGEDDC